MHIFLEVERSTQDRLKGTDPQNPRWFAAPIYGAVGRVEFGRTIAKAMKSSWSGVHNFLVFNVGLFEAFFALLPRPFGQLISLYQWRPKQQSRRFPYWIRQLVLRRSDKIVTYSRISERDLQRDFPARKIVWIPHFVDTDYFRPDGNVIHSEFLLCVGDHARLENVVQSISRQLKVPIIRVTSDDRVRQYYESSESSGVDLKFQITFTELRRLYGAARLVINPVDDRFWPVGITTFCEALSMGKSLVTSGNHSCSGYLEMLDKKGVRTVSDPFDVPSWISAVSGMLHNSPVMNQNARDVAERLCSFAAMTTAWREALGEKLPA